jgi:hypothetical protein
MVIVYLVGGFNSSENISQVGMIIWKNKSHVPNHQPDIIYDDKILDFMGVTPQTDHDSIFSSKRQTPPSSGWWYVKTFRTRAELSTFMASLFFDVGSKV